MFLHMFAIEDTAFSYERELILCLFLQDFSKRKGSSLQLFCNAHTALYFVVHDLSHAFVLQFQLEDEHVRNAAWRTKILDAFLLRLFYCVLSQKLKYPLSGCLGLLIGIIQYIYRRKAYCQIPVDCNFAFPSVNSIKKVSPYQGKNAHTCTSKNEQLKYNSAYAMC